MREFFHGWRRKAGVVTLMMALVLAGMWARSRVTEDAVIYYTDDGILGLFSRRQTLSWTRRTPWILDRDWARLSGKCRFASYDTDQDFSDRYEGQTTVWRWHWLGLDFGERQEAELRQYVAWTIPYWAVTVPLTLLSAYLMLWKPRKKVDSSPE